MARVAVVEWVDGLLPDSVEWAAIAERINRLGLDLLITNEMPFGAWLPAREHYDEMRAAAWVDLHERGLAALTELNPKAVVSSRPVHGSSRLANEAFALENGDYRFLHQKHYFPSESGWYESAWFGTDRRGFEVHKIAGIEVGVLLCTELMFNEQARELARAGAQIIATPRASGRKVSSWETAARMAALVGGCYVASSNRAGSATPDGPIFGGHGFIVEPGGDQLQCTSPDHDVCVIELDESEVAMAKSAYPCYVSELAL